MKKPRISLRAKVCLANAKARWGAGWARLSADMREAVLCQQLVFLLLGQAEETCSTDPLTVFETLRDDFREALQALTTEEEANEALRKG